MTTATIPTATVADAIEQTLEWLDRQGCTEPSEERRGARRGRYGAAAHHHLPPRPNAPPASTSPRATSPVRDSLSFTKTSSTQTVHVQLPLPDHSVRQLRGKVVRVRPAGIGLYEIGVEFTELEVAVA